MVVALSRRKNRRLLELMNKPAFFDGKIAKWWTPDDVLFVDAIPLGATGKMLKHKLREMYREHRLPTA